MNPAIAIFALAMCAWLAVLLWSGWVRPFLRLRAQVLALAKGEWHRLLLCEPLPGELWTVLLRIEGLRRALLDKLRSSTELNLQLESEVARKSADLAHRNATLQQALQQLEEARETLLHEQRLAAIGRVVGAFTKDVEKPVQALRDVQPPLRQASTDLHQALFQLQACAQTDSPATPTAVATALAACDRVQIRLRNLLEQGHKIAALVGAMRAQVRPAPNSSVACLPRTQKRI